VVRLMRQMAARVQQVSEKVQLVALDDVRGRFRLAAAESSTEAHDPLSPPASGGWSFLSKPTRAPAEDAAAWRH